MRSFTLFGTVYLLHLSRTSGFLCANWNNNNYGLAMTTDSNNEEEDNDEPIAKAVIKMDDGGSDLTDRFKYKVNALMGVFDPEEGKTDEEGQLNVLNAMLNFPVRYTFNIVGKTSGDTTIQEEYIEDVKKIVMETAGDDIACKITPRGKNFTKVQCEVEVQNSAMISTIYDELDKLERTMMRF